jgi:hypothetical protein
LGFTIIVVACTPLTIFLTRLVFPIHHFETLSLAGISSHASFAKWENWKQIWSHPAEWCPSSLYTFSSKTMFHDVHKWK